jgi:hypothetical protein
MSQVIEVPELESWFLLHWRDPERPDVLMEFETQDEAEGALAAAFAEMTIRLDEGPTQLPMTVCSVLTMLENDVLRSALATWDAQVEELEVSVQRTMRELSARGVSARARTSRRSRRRPRGGSGRRSRRPT